MTRSQDHIFLQTVPRPISAMAKTYPAGYIGYEHTHRRAQFLYATSGTMRLTLQAGCWIVPPCRAVWLPADYPHQTGSIGVLEMRTLYIEPEEVSQAAPVEPRMLTVCPLLHHLILRACEMPVEYDPEGQDGLLLKGLLGEIDWNPVHPLTLPVIRDTRLRLIEQQLLTLPSHRWSVERWSKELDVAPRTLTRLVQRELGISFRAWQDRLLAFAAVPMLSDRVPLAQIADALGFETAWSFTAMFKRATGKLPSKFLL